MLKSLKDKFNQEPSLKKKKKKKKKILFIHYRQFFL